MARRSIKDIEKIWSNVEGVKKLSDRVIGLGPFGVGLDGLVTWIPGLGIVYSVGASLFLLFEALGIRAQFSLQALQDSCLLLQQQYWLLQRQIPQENLHQGQNLH